PIARPATSWCWGAATWSSRSATSASSVWRCAASWTSTGPSGPSWSSVSTWLRPRSRSPDASEAQAHGQVDGLDVLGQRADGDEIDTGLGDPPQALLVDPAGGFQGGAAAAARDGGAHVVQAQLVEHDDVGARLQRLIQLVEALHLHFHRLARSDAPRGADRLGDAAAGGNVVFLDQECVVQADTVVMTATTGNRVLLRQAQTRNGLAGIEQAHAGAFHQVGIAPAAGRHAGQALQEVQGAAL